MDDHGALTPRLDNWLSIPDAMCLIKRIRPDASTRDHRKLILGALINGSESRLEAIAESYDESFVRSEREAPSVFRRHETESLVPRDFWRIGMAYDEHAEHAFASGDFLFQAPVYQSELPYRLRDQSLELNNEIVRLHQSAKGARVCGPILEAITEDRQWRQWTQIKGAVEGLKPQGRPLTWQWAQVAAELAMEASLNPEIIRNGPGPIIQFVNDAMSRWNDGDTPDHGDVSKFAHYFGDMWGREEPPPPV